MPSALDFTITSGSPIRFDVTPQDVVLGPGTMRRFPFCTATTVLGLPQSVFRKDERARTRTHRCKRARTYGAARINADRTHATLFALKGKSVKVSVTLKMKKRVKPTYGSMGNKCIRDVFRIKSKVACNAPTRANNLIYEAYTYC